MSKQVEQHSKVELSIGSYYRLSVEGSEDFVEDRMTQFIFFVIDTGIQLVKDGEKMVVTSSPS